jgi:hypothetical protein
MLTTSAKTGFTVRRLGIPDDHLPPRGMRGRFAALRIDSEGFAAAAGELAAGARPSPEDRKKRDMTAVCPALRTFEGLMGMDKQKVPKIRSDDLLVVRGLAQGRLRPGPDPRGIGPGGRGG